MRGCRLGGAVYVWLCALWGVHSRRYGNCEAVTVSGVAGQIVGDCHGLVPCSL